MIEDVISTLDIPNNDSHISSTSTKREALYEKFKPKISVNRALSRTLVSFQANKSVAFYNWFKYKEGFSELLVTYILHHFKHQPGVLLAKSTVLPPLSDANMRCISHSQYSV